MSNPTISVGIVTRNRPAWLLKALSSWRRQDESPFEIVVSDDSTDEFVEENRQTALAHDARYVRGPRKGLHANRNHVARHCQGSHLLSSDDDHEHPQDYYRRCLTAAHQDPASIWCIGEIIPGTDTTDWGIPGQMDSRGACVTPPNPDKTWAWSDGATLCPASVFKSGIGFYEGFRFGWSYLEFGCLLHHLGFQIRILRGTGVFHHFHEAGRSSEDSIEDQTSRYFALILHSYYYQHNPARAATALGLLLKELAMRPRFRLPVLRSAWRHVKKRLEQVGGLETATGSSRPLPKQAKSP